MTVRERACPRASLAVSDPFYETASWDSVMQRFLFLLGGVVVLAAAGGFVSLGAFPPPAPSVSVHQDLPPDRFARP
jgi:hypothetical protein